MRIQREELKKLRLGNIPSEKMLAPVRIPRAFCH
jgi:hypothetical protein